MPITQNTIKNRTIFCKDNIDILRGIDNDSIDLIYLDPPFNKNKTFSAPIGSHSEGAEFKDIFREEDVKDEWVRDIEEDKPELHDLLIGVKGMNNLYSYCYLCYMTIRLIECYRILKDSGSIYLHCDPTMSHYLKIAMDCIFDNEGFRNEIVWKRDAAGKGAKRISNQFPRNHDIIFFYSKSSKPFYEQQYIPLDKKQQTVFRYLEEGTKRLYKAVQLGDYSQKSIAEMQKNGLIHTSKKSGKLYKKYYLDEGRATIDDMWMDIRGFGIRTNAKERLGYPTQKPLALLERIITASSNEGDVVLDPFCGCATACVAAERLHRQWIGVDVSIKAYELVKKRLKQEIENDGNLFNFDVDKDTHYSQSAPNRTDSGKDTAIKKYVYVISNKKYHDDYKVGIASDVNKRLSNYQTSDPERGYKEEFSLLTPHFREIEKALHEDPAFAVKREWISADLNAISNRIKELDKKMSQIST